MPLPRPRAFLTLALLLLALLPAACARPQPPASEQVNALKLAVAADGLHRVTAQELRAAGLTPAAWSADQLNLTEAGEPVPFLLTGDSLIFYGRRSTSRYTPLRQYILHTGEAGLLMETTPLPAPGAPTRDAVTRLLRLEENHLYASEIPAAFPDGPWFWLPIRDQAELSFTLPAVADGSGLVRANLYGTTHNPAVDNDHSLSLLLNGSEHGTLLWDGQTYHTAEITLPAGTLHSGPNTLTLRNLPEPYLDFSNLNWFEVHYAAAPQAVADHIQFAGLDGTVSISGFTAPPLVLDLADPARPRRLTGWTFDHTLTLAATPEMHVVATGPDGFQQPAALAPLRRAGWSNTTHQADLIILTTAALVPALEDLVAARQEQGLSVALIDVADIYDEFGSGEAGPDSLRNFLRHAHEHWTAPQPRYLLLVGEATHDYWGYLATRPDQPLNPPQNVVPTYFIPASFSGETVSDSRLVDLDDDARPELAVGRWPVDDPQQVRQLVARTLAYEAGRATGPALFTADGTESRFHALNQRLAQETGFPAGQTTFLNGPDAATVAQSWNEGPWLLTYTGHGSLELWGKNNLFSVDAVSRLNSTGPPPIVLQLTCLTGLFTNPEITSLSERLLLHEHGPVLLIGATSLTYSNHQEPFARAMLRGLLDPQLERFGDVFQAARQELDLTIAGIREVSDTFILFGDPSARVLRPAASSG